MTTKINEVFKTSLIFAFGVVLCFALYAIAGALMESFFHLHRNISVLIEAQRSGPAYNAAAKAFESKNKWMDFGILPVIGCLMGIYAGLFQRAKPYILSVACLLPVLIFEVAGDPVRLWSVSKDIQFFGMRVVELALAVLVSAILGPFIDKQRAPRSTIASVYGGGSGA